MFLVVGLNLMESKGNYNNLDFEYLTGTVFDSYDIFDFELLLGLSKFIFCYRLLMLPGQNTAQ